MSHLVKASLLAEKQAQNASAASSRYESEPPCDALLTAIPWAGGRSQGFRLQARLRVRKTKKTGWTLLPASSFASFSLITAVRFFMFL